MTFTLKITRAWAIRAADQSETGVGAGRPGSQEDLKAIRAKWPKPGDEWEVRRPHRRKLVKIVAKVGHGFNTEGKRFHYVNWQRRNKGRYSGISVMCLLRYGKRLSTKAQRDEALDKRLSKRGVVFGT